MNLYHRNSKVSLLTHAPHHTTAHWSTAGVRTNDAAPAPPRRLRPPQAPPLHGRLASSVDHGREGVIAQRICTARVSDLCIPANLVPTTTSPAPDPDGDVVRQHIVTVCSASSDGLLYVQVSVHDARVRGPAVTGGHTLDTARFVCNALTGQLSRITDLYTGGPSSTKIGYLPGMGLLTQADRGHGPPDRFALADTKGNSMLRFLSETGEWEELAVTAPYQVRLARWFCPPRGMSDQEPFAFGGRLWWVDLTWGAISADPFSVRPEPQFVELPTGSVLPPRTLPDPMETAENLCRYRRMGVSEGRLCYAEVSEEEPFVLSVFALDEEGSGWTLEHRLLLSQIWADGRHPWLPLPEKTTPQIGVLDPLNANVIYLIVGRHSVAVDMSKEEVIGSYQLKNYHYCMPCVLPPWLGSSKIPPIGMKGAVRNKTLADVLVRSDKHQKT